MVFQGSQVLLHLVLKNPLRCLILRLLESHGNLSSFELASLLHVNLGRCCYHLENMGLFISKDLNEHYSLSENGKKAIKFLNNVIV